MEKITIKFNYEIIIIFSFKDRSQCLVSLGILFSVTYLVIYLVWPPGETTPN